MERITIPEEDIGGLVSLFNLSDDHFNDLIEVLEKVEPGIPPFDLENKINSQINFDDDEGIANITTKLFMSLIYNDIKPKLIQAFYSLYKENEKEEPILQEKFIERFRRIANTVSPTKQAHRISQIKMGKGLYLTHQKIQMHVKPVFFDNTLELMGNVITHQLQLSVDSNDDETDTISIEVDKEDLMKLKEMLDVSIKQQEILEDKFKESNIKFLDV